VQNDAWATYDNNTTGSQNYQVTQGTVAASTTTVTDLTSPTLTPATASLGYGSNQTFTASATATTTTTTIPAHTTYTFNGTTYYYYNNTIYTSTAAFSSSSSTGANVTYTWTLSGDASTHANTSSSDNTYTINYNLAGASENKNYTLTVTAQSNDVSKTATASVTLLNQATCATPTFNFNNTNNQVTLSTATAGATIYYTTNGSTPTTSSTQYTGPFEQSSAATIKAIAVKEWMADSPVGVFNVEKLATPLAVNNSSGNAVTFTSPDEDVTFYYTSGDYDANGDFAAPTTSSTAWHTGDAAVSIPTENVVKVIAAKDATATTGYITSDVFTRRVNTTDMSQRNYVFMYDDGTTVHFMEHSGGAILDGTTFNPSTMIWEGLPYANPTANAVTKQWYNWDMVYEPFIRFRNNGKYLKVFLGQADDDYYEWADLLTVTDSPEDSLYYYQHYVAGRGTLVNVLHICDDCWTNPWSFSLAFNPSDSKWERYLGNHISVDVLGPSFQKFNNPEYTVTYPVEEQGGGNYLLNVAYPANYETQKEEVNKGQSVTINASITGPDGTGTGTYSLPYYRVGNEVKYFYYYPNSSTPMTSEPTPSTDIRITYELLNGTDYLEVDDATHTYTLLRDPGRDLYVTVRVTATPYVEGVAQPDGVQTKDYQFNILTSPPFPAPVISRVEGTNDYQMTCSASNAIIEYQIDGAAACSACGDVESSTHPGWCIYDGPITITTAGTIITARSYRASDNSLSDPVDYRVGGAMLMPPTITISNGGSVTLTANPANASIDGYTGTETFYYTTDGSEPDPENVGAVTKQYTGPFTVTNGQEIKAVATLTGFTNSAVSHDTYKVASGTSSYGVVTLNDYEDHNWSYYQASSNLPTGYPDQLHSPYPRNVQITYYGYGENNLSTDNAAAPAANTFNQTTTPADVKVGIGEEGHTFLYYKTLERDANGRFPYELIPNPFYVRPAVTNYTGSRTLRLVMNDAGGDGWNSQLLVNFSDGSATRTFQLASGSTQAQTFTVSSGVTVTLSWSAGGGKNDECSFTLSYDGGATIYESGLDPQSGNLKVFKVEGTYTVSAYTGFYKWRIKSMTDGAIYTASNGGTALSVGDMVDAETTYYFQPSDNGETSANNATSMKVEFEALWARASVNSNTNYGSVERNFRVARSGTGNSIIYDSKPITYSSFYPNGTTDGTTPATESDILSIHNNGDISLDYDTKIEYYKINGNNTTITANNHNLVIGRGVSATATNVATLVRGMSANSNNTVYYKIRLESGSYGTFALIDNTARTFGNQNNNITVSTKAVFGSDYDRAKEDNSKLNIAPNGTVYGGNAVHVFYGSNNRNNLTYDWLIKSGTVQGAKSVTDANADESIYIGNSGNNDNTRYMGKRRFVMEGGEVASIAGSLNSYGTNRNTYVVNNGNAVEIRIKGGTVRGSIYGAAAYASATGDRCFILTGGTINGWVAGGANGTQSDGGYLYGSTYLYAGGNTNIDSRASTSVINRAVGGNVFGAGCGYGASSNSGQVTEGTNVVVADNAYVERGVYGGGSYGYTTETANLYILGGKVDGKAGGVNGTNYSANINGGVFGGACQNKGGTVNITMTDGQVNGGIYGGSNVTGNIANDVTIKINGGQIGTDADHIGYVHGGGLGNATRVLGSVNMTIGESVDATKYVTVYGDVYGGSAQGKTNGDTQRRNNAVTNITMNAGKIHGSLYGGGLGTAAYAAHVYGPVQVTVNGGGVHATNNDGSGAVYGCNNVKGAPKSTVNVDIYGTDDPADGREYALDAVYGGGNKASYAGTPVVAVHNCDNSIEYVYGGGNAADVNGTDVTIYGGNVIGTVFGGGNGSVSPANVNGDVDLDIYGGTIRQVYGGNNTSGDITGSIDINIEKKTEDGHNSCHMRIGEVYGGGNQADSEAGTITIGCTGDYDASQVLADNNRIGYELEGIGDVYGGANKANVDGNILLTINGGIINRVFGANNNSGSISGTITINVDKDETKTCGWYVGDVFGGGNQAAYTAPAGTKDFPLINLKKGDISGSVYGGGYGDPADNTKGVVDGNPHINIIGSVVKTNVYGGGSMADLKGGVDIEVTGGGVEGDIYGGGALADTNTEGGTTVINLLGGTVHNVFGGGLGDATTAAHVGGDVTVTLDGSAVTGNIFGCNNINGSPLGHVKVWVKRTVGWTGHDVSAGKSDDKIAKGTGVYEVAAVYGGGNMAPYVPTNSLDNTEVRIEGCDATSIQYVYGGGNAASVPGTSVTVNGAYEIEYLFGGGNGQDDLPNGDPNPGADVGYLNGSAYGAGQSQVNAFGGTIHHVFGGSNTLGNVRSASVAFIDEVDEICPLEVDEIYGGGNEAFMEGNSMLKLGCITALQELYGGAKAADVGGDIDLTITSGHFNRIFGGNNLGGHISGFIRVNIEETGCKPITIGELYGCGNAAAYTTPAGKDDPTINIRSFTSIGRVFGGGLGATAVVTGNPTVNINEVLGKNATMTSSYAGSNITLSDGSTVTLPAHTSGEIGAIGTVFGGGNAAKVVGNTNVKIGTETTVVFASPETETLENRTKTVVGVDIRDNVFGGGNAAEVTGNTNVEIGQKATP